MGGSREVQPPLMQYRAWTQINFDAGHSPVENPCPDTSGPHGHRYRIRAYVGGSYDPRNVTARINLSRVQLDGIRTELQGTVIDDMMPGAITSLAGIAAWTLERLPAVESVEVGTESDEAVEVRR